MLMEIQKKLKPIVKCMHLGTDICFCYKEKIYKCNYNNVVALKDILPIPYKIEFIGISRANIGRILSDLCNNDNEIYYYKVKNTKNNLFKFHVIVTDKQKIIKK